MHDQQNIKACAKPRRLWERYMLLKWRIFDIFHNLIFVQTHMILEGSTVSIIRNKFVRDEANMGHRVGSSKGMQVYALFSSDDETEPTIENVCFFTKTMWYLCVEYGQHVCPFTHQLPQDVWWTGYIRCFTVWRVVKAKVTLWEWTVRRSNSGGGEIFRNRP